MNKLFDHSSAIMVVIGISTHRVINIVSPCLRYKIYTYALCLKQSCSSTLVHGHHWPNGNAVMMIIANN